MDPEEALGTSGVKGDGVPAWKKLIVAALEKLTRKEKSKREGKKNSNKEVWNND